MKKITTVGIISILSALSCQALAADSMSNDLSKHSVVRVSDAVNSEEENLTTLAGVLEDRIVHGKYDKKIKKELGDGTLQIVRRAYAQKLFSPVWSLSGANALEDAVNDLFKHGIIADNVLKNNLQKVIETRFQSKSLKKRANADVKLTLAWLRTAKAVSGGLKDDGGIANPRTDGALRFNLTTALLRSGNGFAEQEIWQMAPSHPQYTALMDVLSNYRDIQNRRGWFAIRDGDAIEPGDQDARIPAVRKRLAIEGFNADNIRDHSDVSIVPGDSDIAEDASIYPDIYDADLELVVKEFQKSHGLEQDGIIGGNTLKAMNESPASKIDRIADAMHRWRYQGDMGSRYIWANIPSYSAEGWNEGEKQITMRTIVGKVRHATPVFSDRIEYMVANPKWYLPVSIVRRQKVPKLRRDPGYAERYNYNIYDRKSGEKVSAYNVDWTEKGVARKYRFVQASGEGNALGELKIIFPNQYSVYLHGTPGKHLFDKAQRAFSSGCVRLEDPAKMARWIARTDESMEATEITQALDEDVREEFILDEKMPVHITYYTVTVKEGGKPYFWRDIYKRDDGIQYVERYSKPYVRPQRTNVVPDETREQ